MSERSLQTSALYATMPVFSGLAPLFAVVFFGFLTIGVPLPALSLQVHEVLGFGPLMVGWVIGIQSLATVLTRHRAGTLCDSRGPRRAVLIGLPLASVSGVFYLASTATLLSLDTRLAVLIAGRVVLGFGESLFITGAMSWGIARLGPARTGKVMSWQGIAIYAALGLGAPLGLAAQGIGGFAAVAGLTIVLPLVAAGVAVGLPAVPAGGGQRVPFHHVIGLIWRPGLVLTLATMPFAAMAAFLALDYADHGWADAGFALSAFGAGYVIIRLVGSQGPDRFGGVRVAAMSLVVECSGQALLWLAPGPAMALIGATLTGVGFSLVFPSMGVVATDNVPPEQRGRAVGNFIAFFDLAVGLTGPVVGLAVARFGYGSAFLFGALASMAALAALAGVRRRTVTS